VGDGKDLGGEVKQGEELQEKVGYGKRGEEGMGRRKMGRGALDHALMRDRRHCFLLELKCTGLNYTLYNL